MSDGDVRKLTPTWYQSFDSRIVAYMDDDDNGRYVLAVDYDTLESRLATIRNAALQEAADKVRDLWAFRTCEEVATAIAALMAKETDG